MGILSQPAVFIFGFIIVLLLILAYVWQIIDAPDDVKYITMGSAVGASIVGIGFTQLYITKKRRQHKANTQATIDLLKHAVKKIEKQERDAETRIDDPMNNPRHDGLRQEFDKLLSDCGFAPITNDELRILVQAASQRKEWMIYNLANILTGLGTDDSYSVMVPSDEMFEFILNFKFMNLNKNFL